MSYAPPSGPEQASAPVPPPPAVSASNWHQPHAPLPHQPSPLVQSTRPSWFWAALITVPLIGIGASVFMFLSARNDAEQISSRALDAVESAVEDITVPEIATTVAAPPTTASAASAEVVTAAPVVTEPEVATTVPASGVVAGGSIAAVPVSDLWSAEGSAALLAAYEAAISGEPTRFFDLAIYDTYAFASAQDAAIPAHVDEYRFRNGAVGSPSPVELIGDGDLEASLWSLADVDLTQLPRLVAEAPGLTGIEQPSVVYVKVERSVFHDGYPVTVKVYVDGPRGSGYVEYDAAGNLIQVMV